MTGLSRGYPRWHSSSGSDNRNIRRTPVTRKQQRTLLIGGAVGILGLAVGLVMYALRDSILYFYAPSDVIEKKLAAGQRIRLGGLVETGSLKKGDGGRIDFAVTDTKTSLKVVYRGVLPDLFREGQGVITEGKLDPSGIFTADSVLAKHDETYMPAEVAKALKDKGVWQGEAGAKGAKK
jgi:cytochrome c-type biogenesis protein CcmE